MPCDGRMSLLLVRNDSYPLRLSSALFGCWGPTIAYTRNAVIVLLGGTVLCCLLSPGTGRYASLYFIACIDSNENALLTLEVIHHFVEILDRYFGNVCELDLIFNFHKVSPTCAVFGRRLPRLAPVLMYPLLYGRIPYEEKDVCDSD